MPSARCSSRSAPGVTPLPRPQRWACAWAPARLPPSDRCTPTRGLSRITGSGADRTAFAEAAAVKRYLAPVEQPQETDGDALADLVIPERGAADPIYRLRPVGHVDRGAQIEIQEFRIAAERLRQSLAERALLRRMTRRHVRR